MSWLAVGIGLVGLAFAVTYWRRRQAFLALDPSEQNRQLALKVARKALVKAQQDYDRGVRSATQRLDSTRRPPEIARVSSFVLFEDRILTPDGEHRLSPTVTASVDTAGNLATKSRSTLTRMAVGAMVAGPVGLVAGAAARKSKNVDTRELYLQLDGGDWATTLRCDPDDGEQVRRFAQEINVAARSAAQAAAKRTRAIEEATFQLAKVKANMQQLDSAKLRVRELEESAPQLGLETSQLTVYEG